MTKICDMDLDQLKMELSHSRGQRYKHILKEYYVRKRQIEEEEVEKLHEAQQEFIDMDLSEIRKVLPTTKGLRYKACLLVYQQKYNEFKEEMKQL